jgi:hypothetical protein
LAEELLIRAEDRTTPSRAICLAYWFHPLSFPADVSRHCYQATSLRQDQLAVTMALMPLFDELVNPRLLWPIDAPWPKRRARALIKRFRACFPKITYDIELEICIANAQAVVDGHRQRVRLYGGLVRHRKLRSSGLAVVLAHESGHHLGGAPFHETYRWLSSEERATAWALTEGLPSVFGQRRADVIAKTGMRNLQLIRSG